MKTPSIRPAPFEVGHRVRYVGSPFARSDGGDIYTPTTWKRVEPGDVARVVRQERGWADLTDSGEWSVMHDWNVVRFDNGLEIAIMPTATTAGS